MDYNIKVISHSAQRYPTVGDYWEKHSQKIEIRISDMIDGVEIEHLDRVSKEEVAKAEAYEHLLIVHEIVEAYLCRRDGISFADIDTFDKLHSESDDPGSLENCPYKKQHELATQVEKCLAGDLGINWEEYDSAIRRVFAKTC